MDNRGHGDTWRASEARHRFSEVIDAAAAGRPQTVRRRDGREVVIVSKEAFQRPPPTLKSVLLNYGYEPHPLDDAFDAAVEQGRHRLGRALTPGFSFAERPPGDHAGYQRRQRPAKAQ